LFHEHCFRNLHLRHLQLDEIRTPLRCSTQVLWLWLASDYFQDDQRDRQAQKAGYSSKRLAVFSFGSTFKNGWSK
jgi:hypothetical protein